MQDKAQSVFEKAVLEMHNVLLPLSQVKSKSSANNLINKLGYSFDAANEIVTSFASIADIVKELPQTASEAIKANNTSDRIVKITSLTNNIIKAVKCVLSIKDTISTAYNNVAENPDLLKEIAEQLPIRLLDYLICTYLSTNYNKLYSILNIAGIIGSAEENCISLIDGNTINKKVTINKISWIYVSKLFSDPASIIENEYNWKQGEEINFKLLFERILLLMRAYMLPGGIYKQDKLITANLSEVQIDDNKPVEELRIPIYQNGKWPDTYGETGISLSPVKSNISEGLAIMPYIFGSIQNKFDISENIQLQITAKGEMNNGIAVILQPSSDMKFKANIFNNPSQWTNSELELKFSQKAKASEEFILIGYENSSRISVSNLAMILFANNKQDLGIEFDIGKINLVIQAGDGDGFIQKLLPSIPLPASCSIKLGFSIKKGFYIKAGTGSGAGLEYSINLNQTIGPLLLNSLNLKLNFNKDRINLITAISGGAAIGPLSISIADIGVETWLDLNKSGVFGSADVGFGFKPPTGFGLSIKTSVVNGGGYLQIDKEKGRYFGAIQLQIKNISLAAIGLLDTKDVEGKPLDGGFSLLIIICAEIPPIQLGYGFSLTGIGGLLGLNRTVDMDQLRDEVRNKALDSIMFPSDPVGNATQLVETLGKIFPAKEDSFLIAPMVRIGWGVPTPILKVDLSILLELPSFDKIAILGRLNLALPNESDAIISIHLDSVGIISFEKGMVSIDAVLYDSYIAKIMISGQMALILNWKDNPDFVLSIGGFHPAFTPPAGFPALQRIALSIDFCKNARLRLESYFALTTNTIQFGARVDLYAKVGCFSAEGLLAFDTLIYFDPFGLSIDFQSKVAIKCSGKSICSVSLNAHLTGPKPWHIQGKAKFSILFISYTFNINFSLGSGSEVKPTPVSVEKLLENEISYTQNWTAQPPDGLSIVSIKEAQLKEGEIRIHPLGGLKFVQTRVPFNFALEIFGNAPIDGENNFNIVKVSIGDKAVSISKQLQSAFAPAQFMVMSESEKLNSPAFEYYDSGIDIDFNNVDYDDKFDITDLEYETIFADCNESTNHIKEIKMLSKEFVAIAPFGPAGLAQIKNKKLNHFKEPQLKVKTKKFSYLIIQNIKNETEFNAEKFEKSSSFSKATQIKREFVKKNVSKKDNAAYANKKRFHILTIMEEK